jgi:hypothetical protein
MAVVGDFHFFSLVIRKLKLRERTSIGNDSTAGLLAREDLVSLKVSATQQRDQVFELAKRDGCKALEKSRKISDPWFRSQALASVVRYIQNHPVEIAREAFQAADECNDDYKKTAVRAWTIAALAERGLFGEAKEEMLIALARSKCVAPFSSRSEALMLLFQAAFRISKADAQAVADELKTSCGKDSHWRCKRAIRDADKMLEGQLEPRPFYW